MYYADTAYRSGNKRAKKQCATEWKFDNELRAVYVCQWDPVRTFLGAAIVYNRAQIKFFAPENTLYFEHYHISSPARYAYISADDAIISVPDSIII